MSDNTASQETTQDELPQWARDQISAANAEAAKYRTQKNEAVEAAKAELTASYTEKIEGLESEIEKAHGEVKAGRDEVEKLKTAISAGIQTDKIVSFASLLQGDSPDELKSHAEELKALFTTDAQAPATKTPATDPSQGKGGDVLPLNGDPLLQAVMNVIK